MFAVAVAVMGEADDRRHRCHRVGQPGWCCYYCCCVTGSAVSWLGRRAT